MYIYIYFFLQNGNLMLNDCAEVKIVFVIAG